MLHFGQACLLVAPWQANAESDMAVFNTTEMCRLLQHHGLYAGMHLWRVQMLGLTPSEKFDSNMHSWQCTLSIQDAYCSAES